MTDSEIITLINESVTSLKFVPLECRISRSKAKNLLKVVILNPHQDITSDDCTFVADLLSRRLDIADPFDKAYDLVVESPGLEREIKSCSEYQYFIGKEFCVFPTPDILTKEGLFIARLISVSGETIIFKNEQEEFTLNISQIIKARLYCDFKKILKEK
ncbi:MAG: ribosome maturation factor RimP [Brevinema sp.]